MKSLLKRLKAKCWKFCSLYNRMKNMDCQGMVRCVTCGKIDHYKEMQAGHYIDGRDNSVLFNDDLIFPQCPRCNVFIHGNKIQYTKFMISLGYTPDELFAFDALKFQTKKFTIQELEEKIQNYEAMIEDLLIGNDISNDPDWQGHTVGHMGYTGEKQ